MTWGKKAVLVVFKSAPTPTRYLCSSAAEGRSLGRTICHIRFLRCQECGCPRLPLQSVEGRSIRKERLFSVSSPAKQLQWGWVDPAPCLIWSAILKTGASAQTCISERSFSVCTVRCYWFQGAVSYSFCWFLPLGVLCVQLEAVCSERLVSNVNVVKTQLRCVCPRFFMRKGLTLLGKQEHWKRKAMCCWKFPTSWYNSHCQVRCSKIKMTGLFISLSKTDTVKTRRVAKEAWKKTQAEGHSWRHISTWIRSLLTLPEMLALRGRLRCWVSGLWLSSCSAPVFWKLILRFRETNHTMAWERASVCTGVSN